MTGAALKKVLVIGGGGREHALAWKLARSPRVGQVIVAPGNDGFDRAWERWPAALAQGEPEFRKLARRAREGGVDLAVIGPDNPLADGIADVFAEEGLLCFGPSRAAAQIEASKGFAKDVMKAAGIPTARYERVASREQARAFLESVEWGAGWVVKADGLALGKGVQVCGTRAEALEAADRLIAVSGSLVIEERLGGEEISWLAFCDGERCALLETARDYKRVSDGDRGPNTGGMGAFSPVPGLPASWPERVKREVFLPALRELARRGSPFRGVLYAGLMADVARDRFWVIEFNARFGDPETQVLLPRMKDDLYDWCEAVARGDIGSFGRDVAFTSEAAVVVVGAAKGYPDSPEKGRPIRGLAPGGALGCAEGEQLIFAAGVASDDGNGLVTSGGRVFGAVGLGPSLAIARERAYARLKGLSFEGLHFRSDIAAGVS